MRGRKPKDPAVKLLQGTFRSDRRTRGADNPPPADLGSPPEWIKGKALWAWRHFASALAPKGRKTIDRRHRKRLELLCKAYEMWREALADIDANGQTIILHNAEGDEVNACKNPAVAIALASAKECRLLLDSFEGTDHAGAKADEERDPLGELLKRRETR